MPLLTSLNVSMEKMPEEIIHNTLQLVIENSDVVDQWLVDCVNWENISIFMWY